MEPKPNLIIRIPIRAKKLIPPPPAASTGDKNAEEAMVEKLRESILGKLSAASAPLSLALKCQIEQRLRELAPSFHTPDHPPYALMIRKAIEELNDEMGSSENSISEFIVREYKDLPLAHKFMLTHYLGKLCEDGEILCADGERYVLPINDKKEKKARRKKGRRLRGSQSGGDQNRCRGQEFVVKEPHGGGEIGQIEENGGAEKEYHHHIGKGKGRPRKRTQTMQVAEQNRGMVVYEGGNHGKELSAEVVGNGGQAPKQGVEMVTEIQDDLMELLDWNHVAPTMFQLESSESVGQAGAEGTWTQRTWWLDTNCAIEVEKVKQEISERLRCQCQSPNFAMEVKQLKEEMTKMKLDMQELAFENQKVHVDADLLKKTYTKLLEKTKKALGRLIRISHSGAEVENVVEEPSQSKRHSNGWEEIAKSLPVTTEILKDSATTSLDATLYVGYTAKPGAYMDLSLVGTGSTSLDVHMDLAFKSTTMEQLSQEEQKPKLCVAAEVNISQFEQEQQLEFPYPQKPVEIELRTLDLSSKRKEEMLQQGGRLSESGLTTVTSVIESSPKEHQSQQPPEYPDSKRPHKVTSRNTAHVRRRGHEPSKPVQDTANADKVTASGSLSPHQNEQEQLSFQGTPKLKVVDLSTLPGLKLALNTSHEQLQSLTVGTRTIVVGLAHQNQHPSGKQKQNKGRQLQVDASTDNIGGLQLSDPDRGRPPKLKTYANTSSVSHLCRNDKHPSEQQTKNLASTTAAKQKPKIATSKEPEDKGGHDKLHQLS